MPSKLHWTRKCWVGEWELFVRWVRIVRWVDTFARKMLHVFFANWDILFFPAPLRNFHMRPLCVLCVLYMYVDRQMTLATVAGVVALGNRAHCTLTRVAFPCSGAIFSCAHTRDFVRSAKTVIGAILCLMDCIYVTPYTPSIIAIFVADCRLKTWCASTGCNKTNLVTAW